MANKIIKFFKENWIGAMVCFALLFYFVGIVTPDCPSNLQVCTTSFQQQYPDLYEAHSSYNLKCSNVAGSDRCDFMQFINPISNYGVLLIIFGTLTGAFIQSKLRGR
jgi:hypothetical protein